MIRTSIFVKVLISILIPFGSLALQAKPFKRVLVISGGGINPGLAVGMIAGVQASGWNPDLVIATCGAGIGSIVNNSQKDIIGSLDLMKTREFFDAVSLVKIETSSGLTLIKKLDKAKDTSIYPDIFQTLLLHSPDSFPKLIKTTEFNRDPAQPKLILVSSRSHFGPNDVGQIRNGHPMFQEVFFTDPDTARLLKGWRLPEKFSFPYTTVQNDTEALSKYDLITAMRAGIADPYLLNPLFLDGNYYFTGAIDLYPIDLAAALGDEVVASYPASLFQEYEDVAFNSAFGFKQTARALEAIQHRDVKWVDINGMDDFSFNPKREFINMKSGIPESHSKFQTTIAQQWNFGFERGKEAIAAAPGKLIDVRTHLRKPINPKLRDEFTCKNAYEWSTDRRDSCLSDDAPECDRDANEKCTPIR